MKTHAFRRARPCAVNPAGIPAPAAGRVDWANVATELDADGHAVMRGLLGRDACISVSRVPARQVNVPGHIKKFDALVALCSKIDGVVITADSVTMNIA